jgi:hypothetical protein
MSDSTSNCKDGLAANPAPSSTPSIDTKDLHESMQLYLKPPGQPCPITAFLVRLANVQRKERPHDLLTADDYLKLATDHNIQLEGQNLEGEALKAVVSRFLWLKSQTCRDWPGTLAHRLSQV